MATISLKFRHQGDPLFTHLFQEYSNRLKSGPLPPDESWELVEQPSDYDSKCQCKKQRKKVRNSNKLKGAQSLSGRVLDWRPRGCGFEPHCVVSLSKTLILA